MIVGDGVKKEDLETEKRNKGLTNVTFLPHQPREIFPEVLAAADVSLVTLNAGAALSSMPSAIFDMMASARPILAVAPLESELAHIVEEAGCGWTVPPDSPVELAVAVVQLFTQGSEFNKMGQNGRAYLEKHYSRNHCVNAYEKMLLALCNHSRWEPADDGGILL